ncbi:MAG: hypothetical protein PF518_14465 [Spirochaetaceae bacterium]|jgi:hypothetical protein|nr:hypothetical protein [Spirochaetaceae bacterium]
MENTGSYVEPIFIEGINAEMACFIEGSKKIIVYSTTDEGELYDLGTDPH